MSRSDIEIPSPENRRGWYRFFEIMPGAITYLLYALPIFLSIFNPTLAAIFVIAYVLIWVFKSSAMSLRVIQGHRRIKYAAELDWPQMLVDLKDPRRAIEQYERPINKLQEAHRRHLQMLSDKRTLDLTPEEVIHVIIIATYNESRAIIEPTIQAIINSSGYAKNRVALFIAYEQRGGQQKATETMQLCRDYRKYFMHTEAVEHVDAPGEVVGKGANLSYCGWRLKEWAEMSGLDPSKVLVTTLDADNRPDKNYLAALTYTYCIAHDRKHKSYQPTAVYVNNIWDVPAIMRLSAMANTFFHTANSMRLHALRNFSAHAQSLDALIETDFWSVRTVVEDGHQFWRSYIQFEGNHETLPLYTPVYQDAVYAGGYWKSIVAQFKQIRRWTYGASDIAYLATRAFRRGSRVPKKDAIAKFGRLLENHVGWATSAPLLLIAGWIPLIVALTNNGERNFVVDQLPRLIAQINTGALVFLLVVLYIGMATLPQRPGHRSRWYYVNFLWQWIFIPITGIVFNSYAALTSQTRLIFGKYVGVFDVTTKSVKKAKR
ncbi:hypothetical protein KC878_00435 [Candidatus Saccharibacteria bacterium]|nr:hypothetical protein [Candidatus Saccharibacteria bacterium]MCB9821248.1 hypothetical protein [Candidatus Nomurabacteria bacterium]